MKWFKRSAKPADAGAADGGARALVPADRGTVVARAEFAEFLPDIQMVTEQQHSPLSRALILLISGFFAVALLWAYFAEVEQVASAPGVVRPMGQSKTINHPDGGRVAELLVAEGAAVTAGQLLIKLDPELLQEKLARQTNEWQALAAEMARLEAESVGAAAIDFQASLIAARPDLQRAQNGLFEARREALSSQRTAADKLIEQRQSEAAALTQTVKRLKSNLALIKEKEVALRALMDKGYYPRLRHLSVLGEIAELKGQIAEARDRLRAAFSGLEEAKTLRLSIDRDVRSDVLDQLGSRRREHDKVASDLQQTKAQLRNLEIRSPVAGVVQNLVVTSANQSVRPNEPLMNIVPTGESLVIEAEVSNDDIGYISVGQTATVKIRTYDFVRYGTLSGVVEQVAADATEDPQSGEYSFKVFVRTDRTHLGDETVTRSVQPGMLVSVDLHIGKRSILSYLTDRILHTTASAFRER
jgi:HlyD family type I secretion membrane fusion protein